MVSSSSPSFLDALLELVLGLTERPSQLRQLGAAEEHRTTTRTMISSGAPRFTHHRTSPSPDPASRRRRCRLGGARVRGQRQRGAGRRRDRRDRGGRRRGPARPPRRSRPPPQRCSRSWARRRPGASPPPVEPARPPRPPRRAPAPRGGGRRAVRPLEADRRRAEARARDAFADWLADELGVPCFLYGPERIAARGPAARSAGLAPDRGPGGAPPDRGRDGGGGRPVLVAYNVWLGEPRPRRGPAGGGGRARPGPGARPAVGDRSRCR